jgi:hypothetical protein
MIAVFTKTQQHFDELKFLPKRNFIRISNINKLQFKQFSGIILVKGFYEDELVNEAYELLRNKQPELFDH